MTTKLATSLGAFGTALLLASVSSAQDEPAGLMKQDAATGGATDVATSGFEAPVEAEDEDKDTSEANVSAGALVTTGNARSTAATAAAKYRLRRGPNQFSAVAAANYARAAADPDSDTEVTVENFQGKVRFDRFVAEGVALFLAISGRRDRFQGLDLRLNVDPGVAYYFIDQKSQQLWVEGGYDLQYDVRRDENLTAAAAAGENLDKTETRHNARLFAGYDNNISEDVTFNTGLEYLQDVQESDNARLNWDVGLSSSVGKGFSLATTFSLKYDNNPLPGVKKTDTITAVSLVYTLL